MKRASWFALIAVAVNICLPAFSIDTVPTLDIDKYIGRWYQLYGNEFTARTITRDGTCVAADYGLDQATGNVTVINSERVHTPDGKLNTISGYAYGTDPSMPGQLKVHLGQAPVDGDYWVVGLGPATFGPDSAYEWAIVSGPEAESLFVLVRDVPDFEKKFARDVLAFVKDLGFTGQSKGPQRIVQEGCLPFDPTSGAQNRNSDWFDALATMKWYDGDETAYAREQDLNEAGATGPAKDWIDALEALQPGEGKEVPYASDEDEAGFVEPAKDWFDVLATMKWDEEDEAAYTSDGDIKHEGTWMQFLSKVHLDKKGSWSPVDTVTTLDINRFTGRWYQVYSSGTASTLLEELGACVTADYAVQDTSIAVLNTARAGSVDGGVIERTGVVTSTDLTRPGELTLHLDGTPDDFVAPYWIVALGNMNGRGPYPWAIISDPIRAFLFVLVRDPGNFSGSKMDEKLLAKCKELGFTSPWNSPRKTVQEGCSYTPEPSKTATEEAAGGGSLSAVIGLRGGASGFGAPLHASCKMTIAFPNNGCEEVSGALVSAADEMMGFGGCNGGNKCGYTVSKVTNGKLSLVHETSVQHYKDDLTFTLSDKGGSCEAKAFSTSQTWYAVLDNSVNYCNLHNLADASGLEYAETKVSDATCTQYSTADCDRY